MKILQMCPRYYPDIGGIEEHVRNISERLAKRYEVSVFTTDPSGKLPKEEIINGVYIRRFRSWAPNEAYYFSRELKKALVKSSNCYDVVHAHSYHAFPALYAAQTKGKNKLVFTPHFHGKGHSLVRNFLHKPYKFIGKNIFKRADKIICVSEYEKSLVIKSFKVNEDKIIVIPNGVNLDEFRCLKKTAKNWKIILCVSRLEKYKGVQYLIEVLPLLENDVILEIVGKGPYQKTLVKLAKKLGVNERVKFFRDLPRSKLLQMYANADVFVLLSKFEAYGLSIAEALCAGIPCIVAKTSALTEWVDGENCFGINYPIELKVLANLIDKVVGKSVNKLALLDWDEVTNRLTRLYLDLLEDL
ncbi:MAG: glycosyltransferase family 4 protein [Candidatus Bathyarchaeales archaeon]